MKRIIQATAAMAAVGLLVTSGASAWGQLNFNTNPQRSWGGAQTSPNRQLGQYSQPNRQSGQQSRRHPEYPSNSGPSTADWIGLGLKLGDALIQGSNRPPHHHPHRPPHNRPPHNQWYEPQYVRPQYIQPQYVQPQPNVVVQPAPTPAPPKPAPKPVKNVVVKKVDPVKNAAPQYLVSLSSANLALVETDAMQAISATEAETTVQSATTAAIAGNPNASAELKQDWDKVVNAATPDEKQQALADFKAKHSAELAGFAGPGAVANLDTQIHLHDYKQSLLDGSLNSGGKDAALADLKNSIAGIQDPAVKRAMQAKLREMQDFNNLGKLTEAVQGQPGGVQTLIIGAGAIGYPPSFVGEMVSMPIMDIDPEEDRKTKSVVDKTYLFNPKENGGAISYLLNEHSYEMGSGQSQAVEPGFVISFDDGSGKTKKYTLAAGSYKFAIVNDQWELHKTKFTVTLDNSDYEADFHYVLNNEQDMIRAGDVETITSPYPVDIVFDRGDGGEPASKRLNSGTYHVGIDGARGRLDLYSGEAIAKAKSAPQQSPNLVRANAQEERARLIQERLRARGASNNVDDLLQALKTGN